jgi:hypothetical protein
MATAVTSGGSDTESPVADEKRVDMANNFKLLDPEESQFYTMTSNLPGRPAGREKFNWLEDRYFPNYTTSNGGNNDSTTSIPVATGTGAYFRAHDIVYNARTGEQLEVTTDPTTDTVTMTRSIGGTAAATINTGDDLHIIGNASAQFADYGTMKVTTRILGYNYPQTTRHPFGFSGQALEIDLYGPGEPNNEMAKKAVEHKRALEWTSWFGGRLFTSASPNSKGYSGGFTEYVTTNVFTSIGTLTRAVFDAKLQTIFQHGSRNKVIYAAPVPAAALSGLAADNWVRSGPSDRVYGVKVDAYVTGAYGDRVPVIVKREWGVASTANNQLGSQMQVVDMDYIRQRTVKNRGTSILPDRQGRGIDGRIWEWMTDQGLELAQETAHGRLTGITA